jgi:formate C-acetyltransferase
MEKKEQLKAMDITADALILFTKCHANDLKNLANSEKDPDRKKELKELARICEQVPANAPRTFHQALQYYWFIHLGVITELNPWDSFNPGRLDQHLYPFYKKELEDGSLTKEKAVELLQSLLNCYNHSG